MNTRSPAGVVSQRERPADEGNAGDARRGRLGQQALTQSGARTDGRDGADGEAGEGGDGELRSAQRVSPVVVSVKRSAGVAARS